MGVCSQPVSSSGHKATKHCRMPWGGAPKCLGCQTTVYPMEQAIAADRKPFHTRCLRCQMFGCSNDLTARTLFKYEGYNICDKCHDNIYKNKEYGPGVLFCTFIYISIFLS